MTWLKIYQQLAAQRKNPEYLLDVLADALAKDGFYRLAEASRADDRVMPRQDFLRAIRWPWCDAMNASNHALLPSPQGWAYAVRWDFYRGVPHLLEVPTEEVVIQGRIDMALAHHPIVNLRVRVSETPDFFLGHALCVTEGIRNLDLIEIVACGEMVYPEDLCRYVERQTGVRCVRG